VSADDAAKARREVNARGAAQAREKLAQAKADAARRGRLPRSEPRRARPGGSAAGDARRESGDPLPFGRAIRELLAARGWEREAAVGGVFGRWAEIVGPELAAHTRPVSFRDGEVTVAADSTAWATQVRLLAGVLIRRLNEELGRAAGRRPRPGRPARARPRPPGHVRLTRPADHPAGHRNHAKPGRPPRQEALTGHRAT
jgi:predicted nucleic acid-binding Zn ribbon protein